MTKKALLAVACLLFLLAGTATAQNNAHEWANFKRYAEQNAQLKADGSAAGKVVFMGNSITEGWVNQHPDFFTKNGYIGRGISGQTSYQYLLRFRQDVVELAPRIVVINAGTNDIAENTGAYNEDYTFGNIVSMVEMAQANGIKVILTSTLPTKTFGWRPEITDAPQKITALNKRVKAYADAHGIPYVDYYSRFVDPATQGQQEQYTLDGVHPNSKGYDVMEALIQPAIEAASRK